MPAVSAESIASCESSSISEVRAKVPVASGIVIVRSAVGSVAKRVVSKESAVAPSKTMLVPKAGFTVELISIK